MNSDNRNVILAVVLSMLVLFGWQYFFASPQIEKARQATQADPTNPTYWNTLQKRVPSSGDVVLPIGNCGAVPEFRRRRPAPPRVFV